jgi:hypothetical protein
LLTLTVKLLRYLLIVPVTIQSKFLILKLGCTTMNLFNDVKYFKGSPRNNNLKLEYAVEPEQLVLKNTKV